MKLVKEVGDYILSKQIGKGAYGEVYLAKDSKGNEVACKVQVLDTIRKRETMMREIEVLRNMP